MGFMGPISMGPTAVMFVIVLVSVHNKSHDTLAYTHGAAHKRR